MSWDDEWAYIKMKDQNGNVIASHDQQARHGHHNAPTRFTSECGSAQIPVTDWGMGIYPIEMRANYQDSMGDVTIEITNSLNEDVNNESIGIGNVEFEASSMACAP
jgi:hypothetical protein